MIYYQEEVDRLLLEEGIDAEELLKRHCPLAARTVRAQLKRLNLLIANVRRTFPDAQYYLSATNFHLMLGVTHEGPGERAQQQRIATSDPLDTAGGGDW